MSQLLFSMLALSSSFVISTSSFADEAAKFSLTSASFESSKDIPALYTCDGRDIPPQLRWEKVPKKTKSLALILYDPDAPVGIWYHWVLYNIPAHVSMIPEGGSLPGGTLVGSNSWNRLQYNGPCPPQNSIHHYIFKLFALDTFLDLPSGLGALALLHAMQGHVIMTETLVGIFGH